MSRYSSWSIDGVDVKYGDLLRVELSNWPHGTRWISAVFLEMGDNGPPEDPVMWMQCLCEDDSVRGDSVFSSRFVEVLTVEFGCRSNDPCLFLGAGI